MIIEIKPENIQQEAVPGFYMDNLDNELVLFNGDWTKVITFGKVEQPHDIPYITTRTRQDRFRLFKGTITIKV